MGALTAASILADLRAHGAHLDLVGGRVHVGGVRPEELPHDLVAAAREHRDELAEALRLEADPAQRRENIVSVMQDVLGPGCRVLQPGDPMPNKLFVVEPLFATDSATPAELTDFAPGPTAPTGIETWRCRRCGQPTCSRTLHRQSCSAGRKRKRGPKP